MKQIVNILIIMISISCSGQHVSIDGEYMIRDRLTKATPYEENLGPRFVFDNGNLAIYDDITVKYGAYHFKRDTLYIRFFAKNELSQIKIKDKKTIQDSSKIIADFEIKSKQSGNSLDQGYLDVVFADGSYERHRLTDEGTGKVIINNGNAKSMMLSRRGFDYINIPLDTLFGYHLKIVCELMEGQIINESHSLQKSYRVLKLDGETLILEEGNGEKIELVKLTFDN